MPDIVGKPDTHFLTGLDGSHTHKLRFQLNAARDINGVDNTVAYPGPENDAPTQEAGAHRHAITDSGNSETRPVNAYVHWIIRYR